MTKFARVVLGSAILGLFVALVLAAISASGVIEMTITHYLLILAFAVAVLGVCTSEYLLQKKTRHIVWVTCVTAAVCGISLFGLDYWLVTKKAEQDRPVMRSHLDSLRPIISPPAGSLHKAPKLFSGAAAPRKELNCPNGICAGRDINGSPVINNNYAPADRHLSDKEKMAISSFRIPKDSVKLDCGFMANVPDAEQYAIELCSALAASGASFDGTARIMFSPKGITWRGLKVVYYNEESHPDGTHVTIPDTAPVGLVLSALLRAKITQIVVGVRKDMAKDVVTLIVGSPTQQ